MKALQIRLLTICVQNYSCEFQPSGPNYFSLNSKSSKFNIVTMVREKQNETLE
jgi:hypothetical protein